MIYVGDLDSKNRKPVLAADSNAVYASPGYLLFVRERMLMAQPFDAAQASNNGRCSSDCRKRRSGYWRQRRPREPIFGVAEWRTRIRFG